MKVLSGRCVWIHETFLFQEAFGSSVSLLWIGDSTKVFLYA